MTKAIPPMLFYWDGESLIPKIPRMADRHFVVGETYTLVEHHDRSQATHSHYFASLNEAWKNLREADALRFPTAEHLRKWAMVKAGYADERTIVCVSTEEAARAAAHIRALDGYAVITVSEGVVRVYTAKSQSKAAMGAAEFQKSKQAVLDIVSDLIGVDAANLRQEAGRAA